MYNPAYVFRLFVDSEEIATNIQDQLLNQRIRSDYVRSVNIEDPAKWKVIFIEPDMGTARKAILRLNPQVNNWDYFDPSGDWNKWTK